MMTFKNISNRYLPKLFVDLHKKKKCKYDGYNYKLHLDSVAKICFDYYNNTELDIVKQLDVFTICDIAYAHDLIEDCGITYNDLVKLSSVKIADAVYCLTNEKGKNRAERANDKYYQGIRSNIYATIVKLADRKSNMIFSKFFSVEDKFEMYKKEIPNFINKVDPTLIHYPLTSSLEWIAES